MKKKCYPFLINSHSFNSCLLTVKNWRNSSVWNEKCLLDIKAYLMQSVIYWCLPVFINISNYNTPLWTKWSQHNIFLLMLMIYSTYVHVQLPNHILLKYNFHLLKKNSEIELWKWTDFTGQNLGFIYRWMNREINLLKPFNVRLNLNLDICVYLALRQDLT